VGGACAFWVKLAGFIVRRRVGFQNDGFIVASGGPGFAGQRLGRIGMGVTHHFAGVGEIVQHPQGAQGWQAEQAFAAAVLYQALLRSYPQVVNGFFAIVAGDLVVWGNRHKKRVSKRRGGPGGVTQWLR